MDDEALIELNNLMELVEGHLRLVLPLIGKGKEILRPLSEAFRSMKTLFRIGKPDERLIIWDVEGSKKCVEAIDAAAIYYRDLSVRLRTMAGTLSAIDNFVHQEATHGQEDQRGGVQQGAEAAAELPNPELPHEDQE